jgi:hypothetical protein
MDLRLTRVIAGWKRKDPAPKRRKPVPKSVLVEADRLARHFNEIRELSIADLLWIGFFYLLRPGEYLYTTKGRHPFLLKDTVLRAAAQEYTADAIPLHLLPLVTYAGLTFTMQKNGVPGEMIGLTTTSDPIACPVRAITRRVAHLRAFTASPDTPLYTYFDQAGTSRRITDRALTAHLRIAATLLGLNVSTTAGALRCTGATALLQGKVPLELIKLVGRWRSDEVFKYLHAQSDTLMNPLATNMLASVS